MHDYRLDRAAFLKHVGGLFAVALIDRASIARVRLNASNEMQHPDPRPDINAEHVLTDADLGDFAKKKTVVGAYAAARQYPEVFDGLACGCGCTDHGGQHRSLLSCYESQQPTGCQSCREEALFVADRVKQKKTLAEIRTAVDKKFG